MEILKRISSTRFLTLLVMAGLLLVYGFAVADGAESFGKTRQQALHDDPIAQNKLGSMYAKGQGVSQDYSQAIFWYMKAAEQGNADAQFNLGLMYHQGESVRLDYTRALEWYGKAAKQGHKIAQAHSDEIHKYIEAVKVAAEQGELEALVTLGDLYADSNGLPQDYEQAAILYRKAAEQGDAKAEYKLGMMYEEGKGVPQNFDQSVAWYRRAIEKNLAAAKYNLGRMYHKGRGVPKDDAYAYAWISLAAEQGDENAKSNKGFSASLLTPQQVIQAKSLAVRLQADIDSKKP